MSTKLEDLPDNEDYQEDHDGVDKVIENFDSDDDYVEEKTDHDATGDNTDKTPKPKSLLMDAVVVIAISLVFTNRLVIKGITRIPGLHNETVVSLLLSLL